jgi:simple sugar transport system permease protein
MTTSATPVQEKPSLGTLLGRRSIPGRVVPVIATFVLFVLLFGVGAARYDGFASGQVVANLFIDNAFLVVLAVGMTFVIVTGGIDLSVGAVVALSTMVTAAGLRVGIPLPLVVLLVLAIGPTLGLLMGLVIHHFEIQPFIVTLAGMFLARGLCFVVGVESISIKDKALRSFATATIPLPGRVSITWSVVIALVIVVVAAWVLGRTAYAIGGNEGSAMLMGLPVAKVKVGVYVISGLCSSIAGLLFAFYMLSGYGLHAVGTELDAIASVVIGGTLLSGGVGYVLGSLLGVLVLGVIQTLISFQGTLSSWWTKIAIGTLLLIFIVMQRVFLRRHP